jgi:hypothetical protein
VSSLATISPTEARRHALACGHTPPLESPFQDDGRDGLPALVREMIRLHDRPEWCVASEPHRHRVTRTIALPAGRLTVRQRGTSVWLRFDQPAPRTMHLWIEVLWEPFAEETVGRGTTPIVVTADDGPLGRCFGATFPDPARPVTTTPVLAGADARPLGECFGETHRDDRRLFRDLAFALRAAFPEHEPCAL